MNSAPRQERSLFIILAWITITFLIFHTPRALLNVYEFQDLRDKEICQTFSDQFARQTYNIYQQASVSDRQVILDQLTSEQSSGFLWYHSDTLTSETLTSENHLAVSFTEPRWKFVLARYVEKICLILNASLNFVYYCLSGRELRGRLCRALLCFLCCFCLAWIKGGRRLGYHDHFNDDLVNDKYLRDQAFSVTFTYHARQRGE